MPTDLLGSIGSGFSSAFKWIGDNSNGLSGFGNLTSGLGSIYGAYNANRLGNAQIDLTKQQNQLLLDKYDEEKKDKEKMNNSFTSVWGN